MIGDLTMKQWILTALLLFTPISWCKPLVFGVVPQQSASRLADNWTPVIKALSEETGLEIVFATAPDIPTFEARLSEGDYDIAYMNPYHYVVFHQQVGYQAIAKAKDTLIYGLIVVNANDSINSISQLSGQTLAFPSPAAFAATILTQGYLNQQGIEYQPKYVSSHDSVYLNVARGLLPAGGGIARTLNAAPADVRQQLKILWTSDGYTPHPIAVKPNLDANTVLALQNALLNLHQRNKTESLLNPLKISAFVAAQDSDWNDIRQLDIKLLTD
ncbi:phosphate/phosphite/phosphonate ABC transporter substrate-binding protein [Vibrio vulnificus]|nr:phosphate ABC transporter substrate-binding protein [Vibrio vulnificus BAA87]NHE83871.1 phosphate/phosphite/phosphonate ABC transporter substrate-binding protein [Vibrio vulnificus]POC45199.1 phosphate ABC transporter substrate-binding protein [Vibrio vulnificus]POC63854.1 phosphate ABC transporter substrate-binding protein [Vibrio vulnificus]